jgi:hypothetical protein
MLTMLLDDRHNNRYCECRICNNLAVSAVELDPILSFLTNYVIIVYEVLVSSNLFRDIVQEYIRT